MSVFKCLLFFSRYVSQLILIQVVPPQAMYQIYRKKMGSWLLIYADIPIPGTVYIIQQTNMLISQPTAKLFSCNIPRNTVHTSLLPSSAEFVEHGLRTNLSICLTVFG